MTERWSRYAACGAELGRQLDRLLSTPADLEQAIADYDQRITDDCEDAALIAERAKAYASLGKFEQARNDWWRAIELDKNFAKIAFDSLRLSQRIKEAAEFGPAYVEFTRDTVDSWSRVAPT